MMIRTVLFLFALALATGATHAQVKIKTVDVSDTIVYATVDRPGDLYVITKRGQVQRFTPEGTVGIVFKLNQHELTQFDPRDGARLFAYFRKERHYTFYSPSFDPTVSYHLDSSFVIEPWLVTISGDHDLWVLDAADGSLKKVIQKTETVDVDVKIPAELYNKDPKAFTFIREYQGFVFLLQPHKGIQVFNGMGKWLRTIATSAKSFNFLGEELYFIEKDKLKFFNLFTTETHEEALPEAGQFALLTDQRTYIIRYKTIDFFGVKP